MVPQWSATERKRQDREAGSWTGPGFKFEE
jgi:hypothetical protein